jgi:hypothetical protein
MTQTIFHLEDRGGQWIFHFIYFNLPGLYYIEQETYDIIGCDSRGSTFPHKDKLVTRPSSRPEFPIYVHLNNIQPYQREAFDIIKSKFILCEDLTKFTDYEVVNIYGGEANLSNVHLYIPFIQSLFTEFITPISTYDYIYISRKNSNIFHYGTLKRHMLNEIDFMLQVKHKVKYICLEDLSFKEKIELFMNAKMIISSHSGALSFIIFCRNANVFEIRNKGTRGFSHSQYEHISNIVPSVSYVNYMNINEDINGNYSLDIVDFIQSVSLL